MENKRYHFIHLAASFVPPLALLVSLGYTVMYRAVGLWGRYLTPLAAILFFTAGYFLMILQERLFKVACVDHDIDDGVGDTVHRYIKKRFLLIPAAISLVPGIVSMPMVDREIRRLVEVGELDYYSDNFIAPWLMLAVIVVSCVMGAAFRQQPGNITITHGAVWFYVIVHASLYIIDLFMEIPSILPCLMLVVTGIVALFELNTSFIEDITRKSGDLSGYPRLRETNYLYIKSIVRNFVRVFIVPFLLCAAADLVIQYLLKNVWNQPL